MKEKLRSVACFYRVQSQLNNMHASVRLAVAGQGPRKKRSTSANCLAVASHFSAEHSAWRHVSAEHCLEASYRPYSLLSKYQLTLVWTRLDARVFAQDARGFLCHRLKQDTKLISHIHGILGLPRSLQSGHELALRTRYVSMFITLRQSNAGKQSIENNLLTNQHLKVN